MQPLAARIQKVFPGLLKYLLAAIFIFIPLYPKFPITFLSGSTVALRFEDILIAVTALVFAVLFALDKRRKFPPLTLQVTVFLLVGLVSTISAIFVTRSVSPALAALHFGRRAEYLIVFFITYYVGTRGWLSRRFLFELVLLPVVGVFLYGIGQIFFQAPVISTMNKEFAKGMALILQPGVQLSSTFAGHYDLSIYLAMILTFVAALMCFAKKRPHVLGLLTTYVATLWLFTQAGSRIGILGLTVSVVLVTSLFRRFRLGFVLVALIGASILTSPNLQARLGNLLRVIQSKLQSTVIVRPAYAGNPGEVLAETALRPIEQDRSTSIRFDVEWPRALRSFYKNPFLGTGYSSLTLATDNDYLRSLGETGLLGLLSFLAILVALLRGLISRFKRALSNLDRVIMVGSLGVYFLFLISAVFLDVFEASKIAILFWAYMGLAFSTKS